MNGKPVDNGANTELILIYLIKRKRQKSERCFDFAMIGCEIRQNHLNCLRVKRNLNHYTTEALKFEDFESVSPSLRYFRKG